VNLNLGIVIFPFASNIMASRLQAFTSQVKILIIPNQFLFQSSIVLNCYVVFLQHVSHYINLFKISANYLLLFFIVLDGIRL